MKCKNTEIEIENVKLKIEKERHFLNSSTIENY